jgi:hypothetical protein
MPSKSEVLPSLFLPKITLMFWCGVKVIKSSALRFEAVNWLMNKLDSHRHNNIFV